jgi:pimeloyl-ACP methyl ester carboxylesterase
MSNYPFTPWHSLAAYGKQLLQPDGTLFFYDCNGSNEQKSVPVLVFIHGLGDEADSWRHVIPQLNARGYRCIAPDLPGFGRSVWQGKISVSRHAQAVIQVMTECGINRPAVLIGSSMGGGIAEQIAFLRPDLVQSLILVSGCFPIHKSTTRGLLLLGLPFVARHWYRGFRKNHEAAKKSLYGYYHNLDAMSDEDKTFLRERVVARVESDNQERGYITSARSIISTFIFAKAALSRKLKNFKGKITLLWGEHDRVIPVEKTAPFRALRPDAELITIPNAGHLPHQEEPEKTAETIMKAILAYCVKSPAAYKG